MLLTGIPPAHRPPQRPITLHHTVTAAHRAFLSSHPPGGGPVRGCKEADHAQTLKQVLGDGQARPVSKRLIRPPVTVKTHRVRMLPQVELV